MADTANQKLDDDHTVSDNQMCCYYVFGQRFRIGKYQMDVATFSKKKMQCLLSNSLYNVSWFTPGGNCILSTTLKYLVFKGSCSLHHVLKEHIRIAPSILRKS